MSPGAIGPAAVALVLAVLVAVLGGEQGRLVCLLGLGGIIAYLGDILGKRIAKKRISLFGVRPMYTGMVISIAVGLSITLLTLLGMAVISEDFHDALFKIHELKADYEKRRQDVVKLSAEAVQLTGKVAALDRERQELVTRKEELDKTLSVYTDAVIVFPIGRPLLPQPFLFPIDISSEQFEQVMLRMVDEIRRVAKKGGVKLAEEKNQLSHLKTVIPKIYSDLQGLKAKLKKKKEARQLQVMPTEFFVEARSDKNVAIGEELHNVEFSVGANMRIFDQGERIASVSLEGGRAREKILQQLFLFDQRVVQDLKSRGVSAFALEERGRQFTTEQLLKLVSLADQIAGAKGPVEVELVAAGDIYAYGRVVLDYRLGDTAQGGSGGAGAGH